MPRIIGAPFLLIHSASINGGMESSKVNKECAQMEPHSMGLRMQAAFQGP